MTLHWVVLPWCLQTAIDNFSVPPSRTKGQFLSDSRTTPIGLAGGFYWTHGQLRATNVQSCEYGRRAAEHAIKKMERERMEKLKKKEEKEKSQKEKEAAEKKTEGDSH
ncbi:uncharacterized protein [Spinacia oleracea]|uniref:Amine oxidase domain-containing protein n=1 Tax=Spinacia oleracea TaxID=3562 RepID=A0ABM3QKA3_SPIOL|nr:uncharacterized protein LOC110795764 [Spinacia oleracea]